MPAAINDQTRKQVIRQWVGGDTRDVIAIDNDIGEGTTAFDTAFEKIDL